MLPIKRNLLMIAGICAFFAMLEIVVNFVLIRASKDLGRFDDYPKEVSAFYARGGTGVLCIGNSTTWCAVDPKQMEDSLRADGVRDASVAVFTIDASGITTWYYFLKNFLVGNGRSPRLIVLNYNYTNLESDINLQVGRLAQYFAARSDWRGVFADELSSGGDRFEFALSLFWKTFAFRSRLRGRLLDHTIYHYRDLEEHLYRTAVAHDSLKGTPPRANYWRLERFLKLVKRSGASLMVVAFPIRPVDGKPGFDIDPDAVRLIESYGFIFKDMRLVDGLQPAMYRDGLHMTDDGKKIYTKVLSDMVLKEMKHPDRLMYASSHPKKMEQ